MIRELARNVKPTTFVLLRVPRFDKWTIGPETYVADFWKSPEILEIPTIDLFKIFGNYTEPGQNFYFDGHHHLNERGHQITAQAVSDWLIKSGYL